MRYLTIAADYTDSALRDDFQGPIDPETLGLPTQLSEELRMWNDEYRRVIPLDENERQQPEIAALIRRLDGRGQELAEDVASALLHNAKVRYYSEGHLRYVS